ncbi:putative Peptidyl-prolyl cis-trans isomerase h ppih [Fasciola hepatica]|uniref:TIMELESS-interacting protein n=1 Tax=Fasciola hepatica TaxID=6192 RepID=A0A4E0R1I0_FASHE|nr:putative Peptidyl-prolyl cis-trans isomerase h ppih [Fasciola hepatica]
MTSIRLSRFADRVLSSTRISENSQLITDHSQGDRGHVPNDRHPHRRRRLRILDEEEQEFTFQTTVADENTDPSFLSNALPSSIPAPVTSSKLFSDDEDEEQVAKQGGKNNGKSKAMFSEEESDEDEEGIVPLSIRLRNEYDPRISVSERDRLAERSPSVTSVNSEPEEEILQPSDHPEDTIAPNDDVDVQALDRLRRLAKGASKRTVKRPRPKLDPERLLSDRGLPALLTECKRVKFKGRGYEVCEVVLMLFMFFS